jgi:hypothetical protein
MRPIGRLGLQSRIQNPLFPFLIEHTPRALSLRVPLDRFDSAFEKGGPSGTYGGARTSPAAVQSRVVRSPLMRQQNDSAFAAPLAMSSYRPGPRSLTVSPGGTEPRQRKTYLHVITSRFYVGPHVSGASYTYAFDMQDGKRFWWCAAPNPRGDSRSL